MVKSIQELYDKLERRERKRLESGKKISGAHVVLKTALTTINNQSSDIYRELVSYEKWRCVGFLNGMLYSNLITEDEYDILCDELESAHKAYFQRAAQEAAERNGISPEDFDLMSMEGGVAL